MNKRQLELQNQLYTLFEEDRHPVFITNLIEKVELGVIYADLTEDERNEVFNEFKEMHDLNEGFFKDMKEKNKTNKERIFKGIFVKEIQTEDGTTKYKKVDKKEAEYIIKGRKLYTLEGEFIKNINPIVYRETFPELSGKEAEIRIKDKEKGLREDVEFDNIIESLVSRSLAKKIENNKFKDPAKRQKALEDLDKELGRQYGNLVSLIKDNSLNLPATILASTAYTILASLILLFVGFYSVGVIQITNEKKFKFFLKKTLEDESVLSKARKIQELINKEHYVGREDEIKGIYNSLKIELRQKCRIWKEELKAEKRLEKAQSKMALAEEQIENSYVEAETADECLTESYEILTEATHGSLFKWAIRRMNERQSDKCFLSITRKLRNRKDVNPADVKKLEDAYQNKSIDEKREVLLKIVDYMYQKNPKEKERIEGKLQQECKKHETALKEEMGVDFNLDILSEDFSRSIKNYFSSERLKTVGGAFGAAILIAAVNLFSAITLGVWFPLLAGMGIIMLLFGFVGIVLPNDTFLSESVTYVDNAGRVKTSSTEEYVQSIHEYDTKYQIPVIPSVVSKNLKKKNLKEDINLEDGE